MPTYSYVARDRNGRNRKGTLDVASPQALVSQLRGQGLFVTEYNAGAATTSSSAKKKTKLSEITLFRAKVTTKDLMLFSRMFASMVSAGMDLLECLEIMEEQCDNLTLREALAAIQAEVSEGRSLSEALAKHPHVFDNLYISMMEAAQVTGSFAGPLEDLAQMLEKTEEIRRKVKGALRQPLITLAVSIAITLGLIKFAVPIFTKVFGATESLPKPTQVLVAVSNMMQGVEGLISVGVVVLFVVAFKQFVKTSRGRRIWDRTKLKIPLFGPIILKRSITLFSRTLSLLLSSGVEYLQALTIVSNVADNQIIKEVLEDARDTISRGEDLVDAFQKSDVFPSLVTQLIASGSNTGKVPEMLGHVSTIYEEEVNQAVESLTESLNPILTVILGVLIGGVLMGLYLPVFTFGETLQ